VSVFENTPSIITLSGTDLEGSILTATINSPASRGTLYQYTPANGNFTQDPTPFIGNPIAANANGLFISTQGIFFSLDADELVLNWFAQLLICFVVLYLFPDPLKVEIPIAHLATS
jgi:hypothetical protein